MSINSGSFKTQYHAPATNPSIARRRPVESHMLPQRLVRASQPEKHDDCAVYAQDVLVIETPDLFAHLALCDRERLPVGLGGKALRANIGNPDLDGTKARGAQCLAVLLHTLGDRGAQTLPGPGWTHAILPKKVTCNIMHSSSVTCNAYDRGAASGAAVPSPFAGSAIAQLAADTQDVDAPALLAHPTASQSVSSRRDDAGQNHRHADGIGAMKLEAAPRYQPRSACARRSHGLAATRRLSGLPASLAQIDGVRRCAKLIDARG